jgi:hypothetical protein
MTLPTALQDREFQKFEDDPLGGTRIKVSSVGTVTGTFTPSGLITAGKHSFVTVNSTGWTKLPSTPLTGRNGLAIMNYSSIDVMLRYVEGIADLTYRGTLLPANGGIKFYDIKNTIEIYGMSASGNPVVTVEEIS